MMSSRFFFLPPFPIILAAVLSSILGFPGRGGRAACYLSGENGNSSCLNFFLMATFSLLSLRFREASSSGRLDFFFFFSFSVRRPFFFSSWIMLVSL
jgi:hypothetical protein